MSDSLRPDPRPDPTVRSPETIAVEPTVVHVTPQVPPPTQGGSSGLAFVVVGLLIALLGAGYFALGMPGLQRNEARVAKPPVETTTTAPAPTAQPAPVTPAQPRP